MAINRIHSVFNLADIIKCYCEYTNGLSPDNGIMCGKNGSFTKTAHCGSDEICIGPSNKSDAILENKKELLCAKGNLMFI